MPLSRSGPGPLGGGSDRCICRAAGDARNGDSGLLLWAVWSGQCLLEFFQSREYLSRDARVGVVPRGGIEDHIPKRFSKRQCYSEQARRYRPVDPATFTIKAQLLVLVHQPLMQSETFTRPIAWNVGN